MNKVAAHEVTGKIQSAVRDFTATNASLLVPGVTHCCRMAAITCGPCFIDNNCYEFFQRRLLTRAFSYRVVLHAYCLLPREVMLLATPGTPRGLANLLQSVANCYGQYFELRFGRSRQVFSTGLHATRLASAEAVIDVHRFLERVGINNQPGLNPGRHHWSSYSELALGGRRAPLVLHSAWRTVLPAGKMSPATYREQLARPILESRYADLGRCLRAGCSMPAGAAAIAYSSHKTSSCDDKQTQKVY